DQVVLDKVPVAGAYQLHDDALGAHAVNPDLLGVAVGGVHLTGAQGELAGGRVGHKAELDARQLGSALVVGVVGGQDHAAPRVVLGKGERAGPDGMEAVLVAQLGDGLLAYDEPGVIPHEAQERKRVG